MLKSGSPNFFSFRKYFKEYDIYNSPSGNGLYALNNCLVYTILIVNFSKDNSNGNSNNWGSWKYSNWNKVVKFFSLKVQRQNAVYNDFIELI